VSLSGSRKGRKCEDRRSFGESYGTMWATLDGLERGGRNLEIYMAIFGDAN
jgi:hypothetical protein